MPRPYFGAMKKKNHNKPIAFSKVRREAITIAQDLLYPAAVISKLKSATSQEEISHIMENARHGYN